MRGAWQDQEGKSPRYSYDSALRRRELLEFAHDIRNLILPILTSAELLLESGDLSSPQRTRAKRIVQQIDRVESLIEDTLLVSDESSCNRPVDILSVLKQAAERVTADSKTKVWCLFPTAGSLYVSGNEMRLWRALYNLLLNASEAARKASIVVVAVFFDDSPNRIRIDVHDTGPGISPDIQDKIFSCYFTTKGSHVGLGLSLAKEVIENHRGTISVRSDIRNGTIFTVRLPLAGVARVSKTPSL